MRKGGGAGADEATQKLVRRQQVLEVDVSPEVHVVLDEGEEARPDGALTVLDIVVQGQVLFNDGVQSLLILRPQLVLQLIVLG